MLPTVTDKSVKFMMNKVAVSLTRFMRGSYRGVRISSGSSAIFGKLERRKTIIVTKVFSKKQLYGLIKRKRVMAMNKKQRLQENGK